jgi:hypothetical protein
VRSNRFPVSPAVVGNQSDLILPPTGQDVSKLKAAWIELLVEVYGPHGLETERQDVVLALQEVAPLSKLQWCDCPHAENVKTATIPSHLLTHMDSPVCCTVPASVDAYWCHSLGPLTVETLQHF